MPFAGPVFVEDVWPTRLIFLAVVYGPPILAAAVPVYLLARRTGWRRAPRAGAALVVANSWHAMEADLLAYADALRPVRAGEIHWER